MLQSSRAARTEQVDFKRNAERHLRDPPAKQLPSDIAEDICSQVKRLPFVC